VLTAVFRESAGSVVARFLLGAGILPLKNELPKEKTFPSLPIYDLLVFA
jgi:hypothetical protein